MLSINSEIWRDIEGYEGAYQISSLGRVRSLDRYVDYIVNGQPRKLFCKGRILKQDIDEDGYCRINIRYKQKDKRFGVHRLIAAAFLPNPLNLPQVNHKDENKKNNNVDNLEWCDATYNNRHAYAIGHRTQEMHIKARAKAAEKFNKPVIDVTTGIEYESMNAAERELGLYGAAVCESVKYGRCVKGHKFQLKNAVN